MDYKMLHGTGSGAASSRSTAEREAPTDPGRLRSPRRDGPSGTADEVGGLRSAAAGRAPAPLVRPSLEALTSGGKRLRPLLLVLAARMGEPGREDLLRAATAIEVLHTATLIHDDIVDGAETRRGVPTAVSLYGREVAVAAGGYLFSGTLPGAAGTRAPRPSPAFAHASAGLGLRGRAPVRGNRAT